jgi:hypothetical protein
MDESLGEHTFACHLAALRADRAESAEQVTHGGDRDSAWAELGDRRRALVRLGPGADLPGGR